MNRQQDLPQLEHVFTVMDQLGAQSVFVVADAEAYMVTGAATRLQAAVGSRALTLHTKITHPPTEATVLEGVEALRNYQPDVVLALGGGAALDSAKVINHVAAQIGDPVALIRRKAGPALPGRPLIAVPTTAGSGAEATHFALIHTPEDGLRLVAHAHMRPGYVVLDPSLMASLPGPQMVVAGLGALALALESIWNIQANEGSIGYAHEAVKLLVANLENEFFGASEHGRAALLRAANFAGKAADTVAPTFVMAMAGALSGRTGLPYGQLAGALLGPLLDYNRQASTADCADLRGPHTVQMRFVRIAQLLNISSPEGVRGYLNQLHEKLLLPVRLGGLGLNSSHVEDVVRLLPKELYNTNTRRLKPPQITSLITEVI